MLINKLI